MVLLDYTLRGINSFLRMETTSIFSVIWCSILPVIALLSTVIFLLSTVWLNFTLRGIDPFVCMVTASFLSVIWWSILSVIAMTGMTKFLMILAIAALMGFFAGFTPAISVIAISGIVVLWFYGSFWTTALVVFFGGNDSSSETGSGQSTDRDLGAPSTICDYVRMKIEQIYPIVVRWLVHFGNIMLILYMVWVNCTIRGIEPFLRMEKTAFFSVIWCSILSVIAMTGMTKFLMILAMAALMGFFEWFTLAILVISISGIVVLWFHGSFWTTTLVIFFGGLAVIFRQERLGRFMTTVYSVYCAWTYIGWFGLLLCLNLSFISSDALIYFSGEPVNASSSETGSRQSTEHGPGVSSTSGADSEPVNASSFETGSGQSTDRGPSVPSSTSGDYIVVRWLVHFGNIMLHLYMVWVNYTLRGIESFLRMGTTAFFSVIWCSILSVIAMTGTTKFLMILAMAALMGFFEWFTLAKLVIAISGIVVLWFYGSFWTTTLVIFFGGLAFTFSQERLGLFIITVYSVYCTWTYVGWFGLLVGLNLSFFPIDALIYFNGEIPSTSGDYFRMMIKQIIC